MDRQARLIRRVGVLATLLGTLTLLSGCISLYVDNGVKDVPAADYHRPQVPQPVQLLFAFQTKGVANTRATDLVRAKAEAAVIDSGLFSSLSPNPVPGGALLSVTINNVPVTDDAFTKGFVTGLTFGLAGSEVTDGYVCTVVYQGRPGSAQLTKSVRHMIHSTAGAKGAPANSTKAANAQEAVFTVVRQSIGNALRDLSTDPAFAP